MLALRKMSPAASTAVAEVPVRVSGDRSFRLRRLRDDEPEVLVISRTERRAELLRRGAEGAWPPGPEAIEPEGTLRLDGIGLSVPLAALYRAVAIDPAEHRT